MQGASRDAAGALPTVSTAKRSAAAKEPMQGTSRDAAGALPTLAAASRSRSTEPVMQKKAPVKWVEKAGVPRWSRAIAAELKAKLEKLEE